MRVSRNTLPRHWVGWKESFVSQTTLQWLDVETLKLRQKRATPKTWMTSRACWSKETSGWTTQKQPSTKKRTPSRATGSQQKEPNQMGQRLQQSLAYHHLPVMVTAAGSSRMFWNWAFWSVHMWMESASPEWPQTTGYHTEEIILPSISLDPSIDDEAAQIWCNFSVWTGQPTLRCRHSEPCKPSWSWDWCSCDSNESLLTSLTRQDRRSVKQWKKTLLCRHL